MSISEKAVVFGFAGEQLVGVLARPECSDVAEGLELGVLVVVGGPQYRAGSHRQFLLLSRKVAAAGFPVFRFDYRGMGDSGGERRDFEAVSGDIGAAVDAFLAACPSVKKVVLWGLCDAASASLMYVDVTHDPRVAGLIVLNPWVRSEATLAQTHIKHYYGNRLMQKEFWLKLLTGKLQVARSIRGLLKSVSLARGSAIEQESAARSFQARMAAGWRACSGDVLLILSGEDYTAKEFVGHAEAHREWSALIGGKNVTRIDVSDADHTFSNARSRAAVEDASIKWLAERSARLAPSANGQLYDQRSSDLG